MNLNTSILNDVMSWGRELAGFEPEHAINGLTIVQGYVEGVEDEEGRLVSGIGTGDREKFFLFAIAVTWSFWIDEIFDAQKGEDAALVDVDSIIQAMDGPASTPESTGFFHLRSRFDRYRGAKRDYRLWLDTAASAVRAWRIEEQLSRKQIQLSYAEYVENGYQSTAVPYIMATASMLYGLDMASRVSDEAVYNLVRHLSISCRLHNDLFSVEKERREGSGANAVLLLDRLLPPDACQRLVADDLRGYERMLKADIEALGGGDSLARLAQVMPEAHRVLYTNPRGTYQMEREARQ